LRSQIEATQFGQTIVNVHGPRALSKGPGVCEVANVDERDRSIPWIEEDVLRPEISHQAVGPNEGFRDIQQLQQHVPDIPGIRSHQRVEGKQVLGDANRDTPESVPEIRDERNSAGAFLDEHVVLLR
jgi:hypothetical protein